MAVLPGEVLIQELLQVEESPETTLGCFVDRGGCYWPEEDPVQEVPRTGESPKFHQEFVTIAKRQMTDCPIVLKIRRTPVEIT